MVPANIISYIYNESTIHRLVNYKIQLEEGTNKLRISIVNPSQLIEINGKSNSGISNFSRIIEPEKLFHSLKRNYDLDDKDYEQTLAPMNYKHVIVQTILKQYLRENM